ncbi:MAG TPA: hypothetical protein PLO89_00310 [Spirochaetota bacterium]|nr:hypothetical protein [Spirochaetota bacterium]
MENRIFQVDEKCFIIYTGKSSADNRSFLRIGNSSFVGDNSHIQEHIRHIVIADASNIDAKKEKENIRYMEKGKISYICNKKNQDILFAALQKVGVDTDNLYHKDLSKELENVNRLENKKHFFTIFYENKNVKLVFNEEIFFDLFSYKKDILDYKEERERLENFILLLEEHNRKNREMNFKNSEFPEDKKTSLDFKTFSLFIIQDNQYFPLNLGMFKFQKNENSLNFTFNCSQRFYTGRDVSLALYQRDEKKIEMTDLLIDSEVLESQVLYGYEMDFKSALENEISTVYEFFEYLLNGANTK